MPSIVEICNRALSELGARGSITSLDEVSKEARACKLHYDDVRRGLLRAAHWGFARTQRSLTLISNLSDGGSQHPWLHMYTYPPDCLKMRYLIRTPAPGQVDAEVVLVGDAYSSVVLTGPNRANRFLIANDDGAKVVLTNVQQAIGVYTGDITNPAQFDAGFESALVAALAAKLCIPVTGNAGMKGTFEQLAFREVQSARASDGNEALGSTDHVPDWIRARTGTLGPAHGPGLWFAPWDSVSWGE